MGDAAAPDPRVDVEVSLGEVALGGDGGVRAAGAAGGSASREQGLLLRGLWEVASQQLDGLQPSRSDLPGRWENVAGGPAAGAQRQPAPLLENKLANTEWRQGQMHFPSGGPPGGGAAAFAAQGQWWEEEGGGRQRDGWAAGTLGGQPSDLPPTCRGQRQRRRPKQEQLEQHGGLGEGQRPWGREALPGGGTHLNRPPLAVGQHRHGSEGPPGLPCSLHTGPPSQEGEFAQSVGLSPAKRRQNDAPGDQVSKRARRALPPSQQLLDGGEAVPTGDCCSSYTSSSSLVEMEAAKSTEGCVLNKGAWGRGDCWGMCWEGSWKEGRRKR